MLWGKILTPFYPWLDVAKALCLLFWAAYNPEIDFELFFVLVGVL